MMAKALEHNGATVYIIGRRKHVLEAAASEHAVSSSFAFYAGHLSSAAALCRSDSDLTE